MDLDLDLPNFDRDGLAAVVAANIRYEAARYELTQQDLANIIGRSRSSVSLRLRGMVPWTMDEVGRFADAVGMRPGDLLAKPHRPRRSFW